MESMEVNHNSINEITLNKAIQRKNCYEELMNDVEQIQDSEDLGLNTAKKLHCVLKGVNKLDGELHIQERVDQVDETLIDSVVLSSASSLLVKCFKAADLSDSQYESTEFSEKILNSVKNANNELCWINLIKDAKLLIPEVPQYAFTYGTFDITKLPEPKEKKQKKKEVQEKFQAQRLQNVVNLEKAEASIDEIVNFLQKVLQNEYVKNNNQPINYYKYVIDSSSFASTVENMFYCSFLIRNGTAAMAVGENGDPTIKPVSKSSLASFRKNGGKNVQMITSISIEEWKKLATSAGFLERYRQTSQSN